MTQTSEKVCLLPDIELVDSDIVWPFFDRDGCAISHSCLSFFIHWFLSVKWIRGCFHWSPFLMDENRYIVMIHPKFMLLVFNLLPKSFNFDLLKALAFTYCILDFAAKTSKLIFCSVTYNQLICPVFSVICGDIGLQRALVELQISS